jgi:hypothetical protein
VEADNEGLIIHPGGGLEGPIHGTINAVTGPRANHEIQRDLPCMGCDAVVVKAINITGESAAIIYSVVPEDAYRSSSMTLVSTKLHGVMRRSPTDTECFDMTVLWYVIRTLQTDVACSACSVIHGLCMRIKSTTPPASGAGNVKEPRLMSEVVRVREGVCACISVFLRSDRWGVPVFVCLRCSCCHVTGRMAARCVGLVLKSAIQHEGDFSECNHAAGIMYSLSISTFHIPKPSILKVPIC